MLSRKSVAVAAAAAALAVPLVALPAGPAGAQQSGYHITRVLTTHVVGPLQFDVDNHKVYVADSFLSTLRRIGSPRVLARGFDPSKHGDISGIAVDINHNQMAYLQSNGNHSVTNFVLLQAGKRVFSLDLAKWEAARNPDGLTRYGVHNPSSCVRNAIRAAHLPVRYKGAVDSHPYAVAYLGKHMWAVADAGGNDILLINSTTRTISTLAVLPHRAFVINRTFASANHLASCTIGVTYFTEAVPTDVELGPHGSIYVSTLPGGPEGPGVPARGRIYVVNQAGGMQEIGHGFAGATNLAVTPTGKVFVAELAAGVIAVLSKGLPVPVFKLPAVVAVEWKYGKLFAATAPAAAGAQSQGEIVELGR